LRFLITMSGLKKTASERKLPIADKGLLKNYEVLKENVTGSNQDFNVQRFELVEIRSASLNIEP
jgi:hypothetical protein